MDLRCDYVGGHPSHRSGVQGGRIVIALEGSVEILEFVAREQHALDWIATLTPALNPRRVPPTDRTF